MLGHSHATSGALAWAATATVVPAGVLETVSGPAHLSATELVLGTFITAGAALLPDIDHPSGTIAHSVGPVSYLLTKVVSTVAGGHRNATHSLAFVAFAAGGTWAGQQFGGRYFTLALVFFLLALAARALHLCPSGNGLRSYAPCIALAAGGTVLMDRWLPGAPAWLPFAVGLGVLIHLVGDCLTDKGCPLLWPLPTRIALPVIQKTGNTIETLVLTPAMSIGAAALLYLYAVP